MHVQRLHIVALMALASAWLSTPASAVEPPLGCPWDFERQVVELVNVERVSRGLQPLEMDVRLMEAAQLHSDDMVTNNFVSHTGSNGSSPANRLAAAGYTGWNGWGENVAAGQPTPAAVVAAWMASQGHRDNILGAHYEHIGVGWRYGAGTNYGHYWTQDFGSAVFPADSPLAFCPACSNGSDDDGDGDLDYMTDIGCLDALSASESPECSDGVNNDPGSDALIDFDGGASAGLPPAQRTNPDPQCFVEGQPAPWKDRERAKSCGLGFELAVLLPLVRRWRRRRHGPAAA